MDKAKILEFSKTLKAMEESAELDNEELLIRMNKHCNAHVNIFSE